VVGGVSFGFWAESIRADHGLLRDTMPGRRFVRWLGWELVKTIYAIAERGLRPAMLGFGCFWVQPESLILAQSERWRQA
jgi:hypothetical protein